MKLFSALLLLAAALIAAVNPQLHQVNTIYILSMSSGMDQFFASRLTAAGVFQVVTDPQKADAILTDRLGEPFESKLSELYPAEPAPADKAASKSAGANDAKNSSTVDTGPAASRTSSFNRGKGNFFIVDRRSRAVLWSIYEQPKNSNPDELTKIAARVVKRLKEDLAAESHK